MVIEIENPLEQKDLFDTTSEQINTIQPIDQPDVITPESTVQGQLTGLLSTNNPLFTKAQTEAQQIGAQRGLLNTSMTASAGTDALLKSALPIAQQDASTYSTAGRDYQNYLQNLDTTKAQGGISSALSGQEYTQAGGLKEIDASIASQLSEQEAGQQSDLLAQEGTQQMDLETFSQAATTARQEAELAVQQNLATLQLDAENTQQLLDTIEGYGQQYISAYQALLTNPNWASEAELNAALANLTTSYQQTLTTAAALMDITVDWGIETGGDEVTEGSTVETAEDIPTDFAATSVADDGMVTFSAITAGGGEPTTIHISELTPEQLWGTVPPVSITGGEGQFGFIISFVDPLTNQTVTHTSDFYEGAVNPEAPSLWYTTDEEGNQVLYNGLVPSNNVDGALAAYDSEVWPSFVYQDPAQVAA